MIIVRKPNSNWHRHRPEDRDDAEGRRCDGDQPSECFLQQRAREIETFANNFGASGCGSADESGKAGDESILSDWVLISLDVDYSPSVDGQSDDEDESGDDGCADCCPLYQYYTTSEISEYDNSTVVTVHRCPSQSSLNASDDFDGRRGKSMGTDLNCKSRQTIARRLLRLLNFLNLNARTGSPSSSVERLARMRDALRAGADPRRIISIESLYLAEELQNINILLQDPCSGDHGTAKGKHLFANEPEMRRTPTYSSRSSLADVPVAKHFGLNECGDIIIHVDHICEEGGFAFMMRRKKQLYKNVAVGTEVQEKKRGGFRTAVKKFFKEIVNAVRISCCGE